jgi:hypothetical protein
MKRLVLALALAGALGAGEAPAWAQVVPPPGAGLRRGQQQQQMERMQELEARLWVRFGETVRTRLGMDAERFRALQGTFQAFQTERQALNRAQASLRYRLRDPALPDLPDAEARRFLQEMLSLQEQELELYRREQQKLLEVLSPAQVVLFYRLREDIGQRILELRQGRGMGPGGGVGLGPGEGAATMPPAGARRGGGGPPW